MGDNFQILRPSSIRASSRRVCSSGLTSSQYLMRTMPDSIMSFSIAEEEIAAIGPEYLEGTFAAWNFFQSLDTPASKEFTKNFKAKYGDKRVTNDPAEAAYMMVYLWAAAAEKANSVDDNNYT